MLKEKFKTKTYSFICWLIYLQKIFNISTNNTIVVYLDEFLDHYYSNDDNNYELLLDYIIIIKHINNIKKFKSFILLFIYFIKHFSINPEKKEILFFLDEVYEYFLELKDEIIETYNFYSSFIEYYFFDELMEFLPLNSWIKIEYEDFDIIPVLDFDIYNTRLDTFFNSQSAFIYYILFMINYYYIIFTFLFLWIGTWINKKYNIFITLNDDFNTFIITNSDYLFFLFKKSPLTSCYYQVV